jgi:hypothetical protein
MKLKFAKRWEDVQSTESHLRHHWCTLLKHTKRTTLRSPQEAIIIHQTVVQNLWQVLHKVNNWVCTVRKYAHTSALFFLTLTSCLHFIHAHKFYSSTLYYRVIHLEEALSNHDPLSACLVCAISTIAAIPPAMLATTFANMEFCVSLCFQMEGNQIHHLL